MSENPMNEETEPSELSEADALSDEEFAAVMKSLEQEPSEEMPEELLKPKRGHKQSRALQELEEGRRPKAVTECETCPHSLWFATPKEVKCYCRAMYLVVWSTKDPMEITHCDGPAIGQE
jgi:hypothetical protein